LGETEAGRSRFAVALATFGAAVVSVALLLGAALAATHLGHAEQPAVARAVADVCAAGAVGRVVLLAVGLGLLYLATTMSGARRRRT